jgi:hypothetical protein
LTSRVSCILAFSLAVVWWFAAVRLPTWGFLVAYLGFCRGAVASSWGLFGFARRIGNSSSISAVWKSIIN